MKVEKIKKAFEPVVITLETEEEKSCLKSILSGYWFVPARVENSCCQTLATKILEGIKLND